MKPMISEACKDCGGEDCVCCEIYAESQRSSYYEDMYPFEDGSSRHYDDYDEYEEEEK